jgi:ribulose-5-phosphate 4-epimerase/fuculose-1-phosphate aldolase
MSRMRSPELVTLEDIMEFDLDCNPIDQRDRVIYNERLIHGAIYKARPEVMAVAHNHAHEVIPLSIAKAKLRPVLPIAATIGANIPVWDIRDRFGDTDLLVTTLAQGDDLASCLGSGTTTLMRGHGAVVAETSLYEAVRTSVNLKTNALLQAAAMRLGDVTFLSPGEIKIASRMPKVAKNRARYWEYWVRRCGADKLYSQSTER